MQIGTYSRDQGDNLLEGFILVVDDMDLESSGLKGLLGLLDGIVTGEVAVLGVGMSIELRLVGEESFPGDLLEGTLGTLDVSVGRGRQVGGSHGWEEGFVSEDGSGRGTSS